MSDQRPEDVILAKLTEGYHAAGHHPNCATREDEGCDCYARSSAPARAALRSLVAELRLGREREARLREAVEAERDRLAAWLHGGEGWATLPGVLENLCRILAVGAEEAER